MSQWPVEGEMKGALTAPLGGEQGGAQDEEKAKNCRKRT